MRLSIIILIIVLVTGSIIISSGFITNQEIIEISEISTQYENLEKYKNELERINQYNLQILDELKTQIQNADDVYLVELHDEINVITDVINDNKIELEQIIQKLSEVKSQP